METIFIWFLFTLISGMIASSKGFGCLGAFLGFLLGPIGIILVLIMNGNRKRCPYCKELIHIDATRCPKCQKDLI